MPNVNINEDLYKDIREYCKLNKLTVSVFINDLLKKSFMVEKYDDAPPFFKKRRQESADAKRVMMEAQTPEEFKQKYLAEPEPIKKEEYDKPEVISVEEKPKELTPKEKARQRIQYL
jgi:predicted transcriptional regulator